MSWRMLCHSRATQSCKAFVLMPRLISNVPLTPFASYFHPCLKSSCSLFLLSSLFIPGDISHAHEGPSRLFLFPTKLFISPPFLTRKAAECIVADTRIIAPLTYFYRLFQQSVAAVHSGYLICIFAKSLADGTRA